jgi:hypothetical protein
MIMKKIVTFLFLFLPFVVFSQATFNLETATGTGSGWYWNSADSVLIISDGANIIITGHVTHGEKVQILANATANITISNLYISGESVTSGDGWADCPILLNSGATVNLVLDGNNTLKAGHYWPGILVSLNTTLTIDGTGSLDVTGGWSCSGIGGGLWSNGPCGTITINGGIISTKGAASSWYGTAGTGIGGGAAEPGGNITINGGVVSATGGGGGAGMGIGNGGGDSFGTLTMTGNAIVFTDRAGDMNPNIKTGGILVVGNATHWYGDNNFTLTHNVTVPNTNLLTIEEGKSLTIPSSSTLTNNGVILNYSGITINGTLQNNGTIININSGIITGTVSGNAPTTTTLLDNNINLSDNTTLQVGEKWVYANNQFTILDGADVTITGSASGQRRVEVAANSLSNITLNNVSISVANDRTPLMICPGADINLTIEGNNTLTAGRSRAGLQVAEGTTLTINGTGNLSSTGGRYGGAGIGGAFRENCGKITINEGTINASSYDSQESYHSGAAIGGGGAGIVFFSFDGIGGEGGDITINGGNVTAIGKYSAAGIGGGCSSPNGGTLKMNGNAVVFTSLTANGMPNGEVKTNITGVVNGIMFDEYNGKCYGSFTKTDEIEIPEYYTLTVPADASFTIPEEGTLLFNGTINNNGTIRDAGGTLFLNGILNGNKILFNNLGDKTDNLPYPSSPIDIAYLFTINANTGTPSYTIEEESTGEGSLNDVSLLVTKGGEFILGLVTAETYYYAIGDKVTSILTVEPEINIKDLSQNKFTAYTNNDLLYVGGLEVGKIWSVYNIQGVLIYRGIARDVKEDIPLLTKGLFIVQSEKTSIKVINY